MNNRKKMCVLVVLLVSTMFIISIQPTKASLALIGPNKEFSPSAVTYTNKTIGFPIADPYQGYSVWTYNVGTTTNGPTDNFYVMDTDQSGEYAYFGFDEFVNHSVVSAQIEYRAPLLAGTYHYQPLGYFYQKTDLESKTRWALVLHWDATVGLVLYHNTGNGDTPSSISLNATAIPESGTYYHTKLSNLGDQTFVEVIRAYDSVVVYSGYKTTSSGYDATSLYAGFGQYCTGAGNVYGRWDDFVIIDSEFTYSEDGTGFSKIDAYLDEVFTQTLYDIDGEADSVLEIDGTVTNITLLVDCWLNSTTYGVSTIAEGKNIIRQNITVTSANNTVVFSQANLTYISGADYGDNVFLYQYSVQVDFTLIVGEIYTVTVTYEVFY